MAATAAPLAAATGLVTYTRTWTAVDTEPTTCSFVLPAGAKGITYVVQGGGGGMGGLSDRARGAQLSGTFSDVSVPTAIAVVAGGGGRWGGNTDPAATRPAQVGTGGKGFGNGGDAPLPAAGSGTHPNNQVYPGGGGGAGSAILINGAPAVVAGGGGGGGSAGSGYVVGQVSPPNSNPINGNGNAENTGADYEWRVKALDGTTVIRTLTGHGGTGGSASAAGLGGSFSSTGSGYTVGPAGISGNPGGGPSAGTGGNGANGVISDLTSLLSNATPRRNAISSGGGGGGYYGGGSGGAVKGAKDGSDRGNSAGGGGGGGNYVASSAGGVVVVPGASGLGPSGYPDGAPGSVTITFQAAPGFTWTC